MDILQAIILGIVEGVTEFLPVSSTGHLILASRFLGVASTDFLKTFEIAIQLGAIAAVLVLYWKKLLLNSENMKKIIVAFIPTGVAGLLFYKTIRSFLGSPEVVTWSLLIGGIVIIFFEWLDGEKNDHTAKLEDISYGQALAVGVSQCLALIPGVSRAASTIFGGMLVGIKRSVIVEFSFLLAVPTMAAATGYDLIKHGASFSGDELKLLSVGMLASFIVALAIIKWLIKFVQKNNFIIFGIYRIALAILLFY
jgi:undecaprenyl-diphosphatase